METKKLIGSYTYNVTEADYIKFNKYHHYKSPSGKKSLFFLWVLVFIPLFAIVFPILRGDTWYQILNMGIRLALLSLILFLAMRPFINLMVRLIVMTMKRSGKLPFGKSVQLDLYEDYVCETTETAETRFKYSTIEHVGVDENAVYLYLTALQAIIIPRSVFDNKQDEGEFLKFIGLQLNTASHCA